MRSNHGPKLADIPGRVLYGTEDDPKNEQEFAPMRQFGRKGRHLPFNWDSNAVRGLSTSVGHTQLSGNTVSTRLWNRR